MKTVIEIKENIPGLNGNHGLIREHFRGAAKRKERYTLWIMSQPRNIHTGPVKITLIRHTLRFMDWDNMCASFKHLGDALVSAGVIRDDKPEIIKKFDPRQVKVNKQAAQKTVIEIEDLPKTIHKQSTLKF